MVWGRSCGAVEQELGRSCGGAAEDCRSVDAARSRTLEHLNGGDHEARETSACESNSIQFYWAGVALQGNSRHSAPGGRHVT